MLSSGTFITPTDTYTIYEIDEPGFYRIDFLRGNAAFQVDPDSVVYSHVHRRNTYTYGNKDLYLEYLRVQTTLESSKMKTQQKSEWVDGVFSVVIHGENAKHGYTSDIVMQNGNKVQSTLRGDGYAIHMFVSDPIYGIKLEPMNFGYYEQTTLSNDTISDVESGAIYHTMDYLRRRYDLSHLDDYDFEVVTDVRSARKRLWEYRKSKFPIKGFDTETTGLDVSMYGEDKVVGIILAENTEKSTYFPFRHTGDFNLPIEFMQEVADAVIEQQDHTVAHNKKFDRCAMLKEGFDIQVKWDSMQLSIILNPIIQKGAHALKTQIDQLLGKHFLELDEIFVNPKDINFAVLDVELIKYYACPDGTNAIRLLQHQLEQLE